MKVRPYKKAGLPTKFPFVACCFLTGIQLLFACPENYVEIWLVFLFLSREKVHAKQFVVLSSATCMKLGPGHAGLG